MKHLLKDEKVASDLKKFLATSQIEYPDIWQLANLSDRQLCELAKDRDLPFSFNSTDDIRKLWAARILTADGIQSSEKVYFDGLKPKRRKYWSIPYLDSREGEADKEGALGILSRAPDIPENLRLTFHPFRIYVLASIARVFKVDFSYSWFLYGDSDIHAKRVLADFRKYHSSPSSLEVLKVADATASLAIACEPLAAKRIFGSYRYSMLDADGTGRSEADYLSELECYRNKFIKIIKRVGQERLTELHLRVCRAAQDLDRNVDLQRIVRFASKDFRLKTLKGKAGAAYLVFAMAESIRRVTEDAFNTQLPEEDEGGYIQSEPAVKERRFGSRRLLDNVGAQKQYLRTFRLDREIRLRWYVEGETEHAFLQTAIGDHPYIELINLRGQIVARGGRGLAFRENLLNDMKGSVYSWVSIDGDVSDYTRVLQKAADNREMFGMFFINRPDFELQNFSFKELLQVVRNIAENDGTLTLDIENKLLRSPPVVSSNRDFFSFIKSIFPVGFSLRKGDVWGRALASYGLQRERHLRDDDGMKRSIIYALQEAFRAPHTNYKHSSETGRVDGQSGAIVYSRNPEIGGAETNFEADNRQDK